ncbi:LysR family transcriptional regulator [Kiloniella sp.]|uniref:LysR family transcriptional regulator n=1 Tax=Kiloniella sp. TaxID=1938587 RepID=UPI003B02D380
MRDLPPLKALRAFEACYRLRSYTRAAEQLNVGQPAISHQIRQLEQDLGVKLFEKRGSLISATKEADSYYQETAPALGRIAEASKVLRNKTADNTVTLATYPGIAAYWALPRLSKIKNENKKLSVRIITTDRDADIHWDQIDCAILFGNGDWPGRDCLKLISENVQPIAAPSLAVRLQNLTPDEMLKTAPLIHLEDDEKRWFDWSDWRHKFAPRSKLSSDGIRVTNHGLAIHQALQGQGIALGWIEVIQDLIDGGALVTLQQHSLSSERGYWLVAPLGFLESDSGKEIKRVFTPSSQ